MPAAKDEIERRRNVALNAIRQAFDTAADQHGATLFVSHHLEELGQELLAETLWHRSARFKTGSRHTDSALSLGRR